MISVEYVDHMGTDLTPANAARRSFGAQYTEFRSRADGPRKTGQRTDEELISDLVRDGHMLPFRHPHLEVSCSAPIPIARQLGKHQVGMDWSEISRRYKVGGMTFHYIRDEWRADVKDRRQGSGGILPDDLQAKLSEIQERNVSACLRDYDEALRLGAAPEQARFLLPQSMDVLWTWTGSLLAWAHLWKQRNHPDAQAETRDFARQVGGIAAGLFPYSWAALTGASE